MSGVDGAGRLADAVLLLVNRSSGTGHSGQLIAQIEATLRGGLGGEARILTETVTDHPEARRVAEEFSKMPGLRVIVAGGGGGTLRAAIEGVAGSAGNDSIPFGDRVRIAALRLGSGNVVAKQFGVPLDPIEAAKGIAENIRAGRFGRCSIMRCRIGKPEGRVDVRYAATMCGLGQFGRTSGDLARWHRRLPRTRRLLARMFAIEKLNNVEYEISMATRVLWAALHPSACETVEIDLGAVSEKLRLLAGVVMDFPIRMLPFDPGVGIAEPALSFHCVRAASPPASLRLLSRRRLAANLHSARIGPGDILEIRFLDRKPVEFFLDEDPELAYGWISVEIAGLLAFVPSVANWTDAKKGAQP
jgi:diacylglycerol kinase-like protein